MKNKQDREPRSAAYVTFWILGYLATSIWTAWPAMIRSIAQTIQDLKNGVKLFSKGYLYHWSATIEVVGFAIVAFKLAQLQLIAHRNMLGYLIFWLLALPGITHIIFRFIARRDQ